MVEDSLREAVPAWRLFPRKKGRIKTENVYMTRKRDPDEGNHLDKELKNEWCWGIHSQGNMR